jgi:hypothetical protein
MTPVLQNAFENLSTEAKQDTEIARLEEIRAAVQDLASDDEGVAREVTLDLIRIAIQDLASDDEGIAREITLTQVAASLATIAQALDNRFGGGKLPHTQLVSNVGDTILLTPTEGSRLIVYWVSAINDPDASATPKVTYKFGDGQELYFAPAVAHWEPFPGPINNGGASTANSRLLCELDVAGDVPVTVHYKEVAP